MARRDGKVLLVRQRGADPVWDLPGGMVEEIRCADPDGDVVAAEWVAVSEAIRRLSEGRAAHMRDPAMECLTRAGDGVRFWAWPDGLDRGPRVL
ncbi:hypothetical protein AB0K18_21915 [Nonomuraea sp. NPDC049421]|uniref:hypothetical protein n=1 Tax=Nonomuraea sp. NPDC049421 TaxID=3155275 RepID=UPI003442141F